MIVALLSVWGVLFLAGSVTPVFAADTPQPYSSDKNLPLGTIIQLDESDAKKVIPASQEKLNKMFGVTASQGNLPITVTHAGSDKDVYVVTEGKYNVLVSNENGVVKTGENVTMSSINGTGMKASTDQEIILGKALSGFDGKNNVISTLPLKYDDGKVAKTVAVGMVQVAIDIKHNPDVHSTKTKLPPQLERIGEQIAEKPLSPFRIYLSVAVVAISIIIAVVVLYAGIRNSIISVGRNPLSKKSIFAALLQVILSGFIILIIGLFTVYLLLKL
jgi:hypothetical protein